MYIKLYNVCFKAGSGIAGVSVEKGVCGRGAGAGVWGERGNGWSGLQEVV